MLKLIIAVVLTSSLLAKHYLVKTKDGEKKNIDDIKVDDSGEDGNDYSLMIYGNNADKNEYPWQVRLDINGGMCGGSIIHQKYLLTAAVCTEGKYARDITAWVSDHNRRVSDGESDHEVCGIVQHPDYSGEPNYDNNIAILRLCDPLEFSRGVEAISLAEAGQDYENQIALLTGWGRNRQGYNNLVCGSAANILQEVNVYTVSNKQCREEKRFDEYSISDSMICSTTPGRGLFKGDTGGPLVSKGRDGRYSLIGIVSFSDGCQPGWPNVYTRITSFLDWIKENIN